ncbi:Hypothetical predicted protein [Paramuricea clavata]|uniref:Uncharacterized protein n=1 Tax=Paramuricea clavata TaxID=317549 RepID=A0A7D9LS70_PARCT|nr:Hypothetical predicted protein [Paramuricea clavata]
MILEELVGVFVSLGSSVVKGTPQISRETLRRELIIPEFEENTERHEISNGFIHREYEQEADPELPYQFSMKKVFRCKPMNNPGAVSVNHSSKVVWQISD